MKSSLVIIILFAAVFSSASAQNFLTRWTFEGDTGVNMGITTGFGPVQPQGATTSSTYNSTGTHATDAWAPAIATYNPGSYFEFTLSATDFTAPYTVNSIAFDSASFLNGATGWEVRSNLDNFSLVLGSGATNTPSGANLTNLGLDVGAGQFFTFRIIGTGANAADVYNGFIVDQVTVTGAIGAVSAVPEPSTYAAILGAFAIIGAVIQRRRMRSGAAVPLT
ncbi:MAG: hypothetical protein H7A44_02125 [Opitutaceae bacterium]|nr:hypothetical protein [Cephaloticoccus sp.]MCP5529213.1 hypothetical protein [Opitutaceae bacterium]